ncbi:MAG: hypothetical protein FWJ93_05950 [Micromonosporaceae bacterium]
MAAFDELFAGLVARLNELYAGYTDEQLALILDFLRRSARLQREATAEVTRAGARKDAR